MPRDKAPVTELGNIYAHRREFHAHIQFRDDDGNKNKFMDQVVVLKVKHKKTWTKFVRLELSEQRAKKV